MGQQLPGTLLKVAVDFALKGLPAFAIPGSVDFFQLPGVATAQAEVVLSDGDSHFAAPIPPKIVNVSSDATWLTAAAQAQTLPVMLTIAAVASGLAPGIYHGSVQVQIDGAVKSRSSDRRNAHYCAQNRFGRVAAQHRLSSPIARYVVTRQNYFSRQPGPDCVH